MSGNKNDRKVVDTIQHIKRKLAVGDEAPTTKEIMKRIQDQTEALRRDERMANKARQVTKKNMEPRNKRGLPQSTKSTVKTTKVMAVQTRNQLTTKVAESRKKLQDLYTLLSHTTKDANDNKINNPDIKSSRPKRR